MEILGFHFPGTEYSDYDDLYRMRMEELDADHAAGKLSDTDYNVAVGKLQFEKLNVDQAAAKAKADAPKPSSSSGWSFSNPLGFLGPVTDLVKWVAIGGVIFAGLWLYKDFRK